MKTVMIFGTFDIVHAGHLHMFREAREYGDRLVVVVARDKNVERVKGMGAMHTEQERVEFLQHIDLIDTVMLGDKSDPYRCIKDVCPDIIALGYDQKEYIDNLADELMRCGLHSRIVRLAPYQEKIFKSSKIKKYIERLV